MVQPSPSKLPLRDSEEKKGFKEKFTSSLSNLRSNEKLEKLIGHATANTRDTVSYVVMIIGLVLLFFHSFYGGALIGLVAGLYFSSEILAFLRNLNAFIDEQGVVKALIGGGLLFGLFISAPAIFIGLAVAVALRQILFPEA